MQWAYWAFSFTYNGKTYMQQGFNTKAQAYAAGNQLANQLDAQYVSIKCYEVG